MKNITWSCNNGLMRYWGFFLFLRPAKNWAAACLPYLSVLPSPFERSGRQAVATLVSEVLSWNVGKLVIVGLNDSPKRICCFVLQGLMQAVSMNAVKRIFCGISFAFTGNMYSYFCYKLSALYYSSNWLEWPGQSRKQLIVSKKTEQSKYLCW